jgi:hypothetical protein
MCAGSLAAVISASAASRGTAAVDYGCCPAAFTDASAGAATTLVRMFDARIHGRGGQGVVTAAELLASMSRSWSVWMEPEDVFALSRGIDRLLNYARDLIDESDAMACPPDARIAGMAAMVGGALRHIDAAVASLGSHSDAATAAADAAIAEERRLERAH